MPRRVEDIVPGDHRSIRDIPIGLAQPSRHPSSRESTSAHSHHHKDEREIPIHKISLAPVMPPAPRRRKPSKFKRFAVIMVGIVVVLAGAAFLASQSFARATFTIVPRTIPITINKVYVASATTTDSTAGYETITVSLSASTTVPSSPGPAVSLKARGDVTLYNAYQSQPMRLVAGTRLANGSGKIYRLTSSVVIPGYTISSGTTVPGKVGATIVADQAGETYNMYRTDSADDLEIVAYKGTAKYGKVYARTVSDISGGFVGKRSIVSQSVMASTSAILEKQLSSSLQSELIRKVPGDRIMYDTGRITSFTSPSVDGGGSSSSVSIRGTMIGVVFNKSDLVKNLAGEREIGSFGHFTYDVSGLPELNVRLANPKDLSSQKKSALIFNIQGNLKLIGSVPIDELKRKLSGITLADTADVIKSYSQVIETGTGEINPPWSKVPSDPGRISVVISGK